MNATVIRQANQPDIQSICQLQQQWYDEDSVYGFVPDAQERIQAALGPYFLVAEIDGTIIGFISGSVHISEGTTVIPAGESYLEIDNLYVSPPFRQRGIGSRLVKQVLAHAKSQGVTHALLYSSTTDIHSILRFYEQHNFQSWYVQMFRKI